MKIKVRDWNALSTEERLVLISKAINKKGVFKR